MQEYNSLKSPDYTSSHWPGIANPLLHYRTKDFNTPMPFPTDPADFGKTAKVRVLDEMQSDWAQRARDQGTRDPALAAELETKFQAAQAGRETADQASLDFAKQNLQYVPKQYHDDLRLAQEFLDADAGVPKDVKDKLWQLNERWQQARNVELDAMNKVNAAKSGVPSAPFISNTSDWVDLGLKQALSEAARDPSVSRFAWAPGAEHVRRYPSLGDVVDAVDYKRNPNGTYGLSYQKGGRGNAMGEGIAPEDLAQYVGRDVADQILAGKGSSMNWAGNNEEPSIWNTIKGDDLNVRTAEGVGMGKYYGDFDKEGKYNPGIVGTRLLKLLKSLDPEAAKIEAHVLDRPAEFANSQFKSRPVAVTRNERGRPVIELEDGSTFGNYADMATATEHLAELKQEWQKKYSPYPSIPITPKLREALKKGIPMFSAAGIGYGLTASDHGSDAYPATPDAARKDGGIVDGIMDILKRHYGDEAYASPQGTPYNSYHDIPPPTGKMQDGKRPTPEGAPDPVMPWQSLDDANLGKQIANPPKWRRKD